MSNDIHTVARMAGVSAGTVSRVLRNRGGTIAISQRTRRRVMEVAERLKYRPNAHARAFRSRRSQQLGLIVPDLSKIVRGGHAFSDPNLAEVLSGIEEKVTVCGYRLVLLVANDLFQAKGMHMEVARDHSVDGLLVWGGHANDRYIQEVLSENIPCIQVRSCVPGQETAAVVADDEGGTRMVTEYLLKLGHRHIGYLGGPEDVVAGARRRAGFRLAMAEYEQTKASEQQLAEGEFTEEGGYQAAAGLLRNDSFPTAIVAFNDLTALGVYRAARELGLRIPRDVSVVGGDGIDLCRHVMPSLTTFRIPCFEIGMRAAERLIEQVEENCKGTKCQEIEVLPAGFQSGRSTAPPPEQL